ncbi:MAG: Gfo/Idh/MocA family oxidoreductase [Thermoguttaceae bacterium]|jgi:predicted dehydrogenase|nr:Gfo/Idh/MocA family oxidoreductase [Thermoguttaceae bacterium]
MHYTRRHLLRRAAATAAVAACPTLIPAGALGNGEKPAPSNRVTLGYLGVGPRGLLNCREALGCPEAQVLAVCDVWDHVLLQAKQTVDAHYGNQDCRSYVDFRDILVRDDIDAVSIATPDHWHVPMAVLAAEAGKDVSLEKPMGVAFAEDQACRAAVRRYGRVFQYGTEARAMAACRLGCELIRNGCMGELREIRVKAPDSVGGGSRIPKPVPDGLHYDLWLGPAPWRPYSGCPDNGPGWYHVYDYALGFIAGWGAHPLDLLVWAYDAHEHGPWEVEGTGRINRGDCNDAVHNWDVRIRLANGVTISYWAHGLPTDEDPRLAKLGNYVQFIGTEGWIAPYYGGMLSEPASLGETPLEADAVRLPVSSGQERNFIECVRSRQTPVGNIDDAVRSDMISHIADIAVRSGRKIVWDPVKERIEGDEQASRRLTRAYRAPWNEI